MPSTSVFDAQDESYRERVLPRQVERRVAVEAAAPETWWRYVGSRGAVVGMTSFGASGVAKDLFKHFGFTPENVVAAVEGCPSPR
jgi:transketolase